MSDRFSTHSHTTHNRAITLPPSHRQTTSDNKHTPSLSPVCSVLVERVEYLYVLPHTITYPYSHLPSHNHSHTTLLTQSLPHTQSHSLTITLLTHNHTPHTSTLSHSSHIINLLHSDSPSHTITLHHKPFAHTSVLAVSHSE